MTRALRLEQARETASQLGVRLAGVRMLRGLTMAQVEKKTGKGIERSALSRIENGSRTNPSLATLLMLCNAYEIDMLIRRDGTLDLRGTRLHELAAAERRSHLPQEGTK